MERMISALIIDDDVSAREILRKFLENQGDVIVVADLSDTSNAVQKIMKHRPDVLFLDINMPVEDGLQFASRMKTLDVKSLLVFTTAFRNYALDAFSLKPYDFLVKPFGIGEVISLMGRIREELLKMDSEKLIWGKNIGKLKFKTSSGYIFLTSAEIAYIQSSGNNCELTLSTGEKIRVISTISELYPELGPNNFVKLSRSVIVNFHYVVRVEKKLRNCILKVNNKEVELSVISKYFGQLENMNSLGLG